VVRAALVLRTLTRPVSLVLAYARVADNKKMAKIAHKINMCVSDIKSKSSQIGVHFSNQASIGVWLRAFGFCFLAKG
jgi:hypothetical protein